MLVTINSELLANGLKCPPGKRRIEFVDSGGVPGLYVEVRATGEGEGTYYLRYKDVHGKTCHQRIGGTKETSLSDARKRAIKLRAQICLGSDPRAAAKARKAVPTFIQFHETLYMPYITPRKRSAKRDAEIFRLHVAPTLGSTRIDKITRQQVQAIMTGMTERGLSPGSADLVGRFVRHALNLAMDWKYIEVNPTARLPMFNVDSRVAHYLDDAQLQRLLQVLRSDRNQAVCRIALMLLSSGCRLREILAATWSEVDLERRVFTIRATNSKSRKLRSVPLNDAAIAVLNSLDTRKEGGPLFVSSRTGVAFTTIAKQWDRIRKQAGLPHLRLHDLRHSFASFLINDGRTLFEVQAILGHSSSRVTERYCSLSSRTLQNASASASAKLTGNVAKSTG
jgi:integrase